MFCAISGVTPEEPVINTKTGYVYEKRLILQHLLSSGGKDPETGDEMSEADLLPIKVSGSVAKPQPTTATSIPGALVHLRNEWDAMMLETHKLKQSLKTTRQELSQSLYYYDAALRVIARLTTERDEARQGLAELATPEQKTKIENGGDKVKEGDMDVDTEQQEPTKLSEEVLEEIDQKADALQKWRKKRPAIPGLKKPSDISSFEMMHKGGVEEKGVCVIRAEPVNPSEKQADQAIVVGCDDGFCRVLDFIGSVQTEFEAHRGAVRGLALSQSMDVILSGGDDGVVRIWRKEKEKYAEKSTLKTHKKGISACSMHPTESYFAAASLDASWTVNDIESGKTLTQVFDPNNSSYQCAEFHPDGAIFATGAGGVLRIWDVRTLTPAAAFETDSALLSSVILSENGYLLGSAGDEKVQLWDLRKLKATKEFDVEKEFGLSRAAFDLSGNFLALCGAQGVKVLDVKKWKELVSLEGTELTCVAWQRTASWLCCGSKSGAVTYFGRQ